MEYIYIYKPQNIWSRGSTPKYIYCVLFFVCMHYYCVDILILWLFVFWLLPLHFHFGVNLYSYNTRLFFFYMHAFSAIDVRPSGPTFSMHSFWRIARHQVRAWAETLGSSKPKVLLQHWDLVLMISRPECYGQGQRCLVTVCYNRLYLKLPRDTKGHISGSKWVCLKTGRP
jgi:hypothetical protein